MSKISTVNSQRNSTANAWARGPPTSSAPTTNTSQPAPSQAPVPSTPTTPTASSGPRTNGQPAHSRRSSAALTNAFQPPPSTLKEPVAVGKNVASPLPAKSNNVTFGSIDDTNATLSTSPAPPSAMTDIKPIKSFGSISTATGDATPPSGSENKIAPPARTDSPAPAGKVVKKKLDVNSLFQKKQAGPSAPASPATGPTASPRVVPSTIPPAQPPQTPTSQAPPETPSMRPSVIHQSSYDSPSMRNSPLPIVNHPLNQMPSQMPPGPNPNQYHFAPPNMRPGGNAGPGANPPRSPNISRAMTNGNMRGPPGTPGPGVHGSPRMGPLSMNAPAAPPVVPTPMPGVPPGMMNAPNAPVSHPPPHMPMPPMPHGQMPHMGMPPGAPMWQYYYPPPHFDPMAPQFYWPGPPPGHMGVHPPPPGSQQQATIPLPPSGMPTPSTAPMPMSPRVPSTGPSSAAPPTPATPHAALAQAPPGQRTSYVAPRRPIAIKNSAGEEIDLFKTRLSKPEEAQGAQPAKKDDPTERRPISIRMETEDAHKRRIEEEKLKDKDKFRKDEELARTKAKRDAEARERAKRDHEEKERRRREMDDAERKKVEDEEKVKRDAEEAEQREKDKIRLAEEERLRKIEEEKERAARLEAEEKERVQRQAEEEAEAKRKAEEDKRKAEEEAKLKEEEEKRKAEEEAKRLEEESRRKAEEEEKARIEAETARKAKEAEEARLAKEKEEQEAAAAAAAAAASVPPPATETTSQSSTPAGSTPAYASPAHSTSALPKSALPPALDPNNKRRPIPGRLDLSGTSSANLPQPLPSALASARIIEDIGKVSYPEGIKAPSSELNVNAASGRFRYDRDFLMQFMKVCKEKPDDMPPLDAIGLEPSDQQGGFSGRRGGGRAPLTGTGSARSAVGLGVNGPGGVPFGGKIALAGNMGQFQAPSGRTSEDRFAASQRVSSGQVPFPGRPVGRTNSTTGPPMSGPGSRRDAPQRSHSNKGMKRTDSRVGPGPLAMQSFPAPDQELHHAENSWSTQRKPAGNADQNTPEFVDRKVKALLNKLTMEKFESISKQILEWANRSVNENDGRTLIQVIRLVFEKATDEATWSEMYARLCRFLMERISQDVRDEGIKNADGKPIAGGNLFRKYLLNRCQEDFERGWSAKEAAAVAAAASKADDEKAAAAAEKSGEEVLYSDEYYASQKAKRRGLGLVKFIGELFKLQMLTERIMHECIKKLLSNVENPEEEEIESLCKLLSTVGQALDTEKARNHMDIYFTRMQELANSGQISSRIQFMLSDVIELRHRKWVSRTQAAAPTTIAEVHQKAERDRQVAEREAALRQAGGRDNLRGGRRDTRDYGPPQVGADGWTTPQRLAATKVGDMSQFGKITKTTNMQFGPSSVFSKKDKRESMSSVTRASSSSNMFAALNSSEATPDAASVGSRTANSTRPPSRKGSVDFGAEPQRRRLMLNPRTQNITSDAGSVRDEAASTFDQSETGDDEAASTAASASGQSKAPTSMTEDQAKRRVKEDMKELFSLRQLSEAEGYFTALPANLRWILVEQLMHHAIDARLADVQLVADVFDMAATKSLVDEDQFSQAFASDLEYLEDTSTDSPNAYGNVATLMKAAKLSQDAVERLAEKIIMEGDMAVTPKEKLLRKYAALST